MSDERYKELEAEVLEGMTFDWDAVKKEVPKESVEWEGENDLIVQRTWLGSIMTLSPSGKIYTPFANSNVVRCDKCNGNGCEHCLFIGSVEAAKDEIFQELLEKKLEEIGLYIHWFDSDIFAERSLDSQQFCNWFKEDVDENGMEEFAALLDVDEEEAATIWALAIEEDVESITEHHPDAAMKAFNKWHEQEKEI